MMFKCSFAFGALSVALTTSLAQSAFADKPQLFFVGSEWYGPSRATLDKTVKPLKAKYGANIDFIILDMDVKADAAIATTNGIKSKGPVFMLKQGDRTVLRQITNIDQAQLDQILAAAAQKEISLETTDGKNFTINDWVATGIKVDKALYGNDDVTKKVASFCNYKPTCTYKSSIKFMVDDPANYKDPGPVAFKVTYHCLPGSASKTETQKAPALDQLTTLNCDKK